MAEVTFEPVADVRAEVEAKQCRKDVVDISDLKVEVVPPGSEREAPDLLVTLPTVEQPFFLAEDVVSRFSRLTGVSPRIYREFYDDSSLAQSMITHSLKKRQGGIHVVTQGPHIIAVADGETPLLTPLQVLDTVAQSVSPMGVCVKGQDGLSEMRFLLGRTAEPPKHKGDISHAGIFVELFGGPRGLGQSKDLRESLFNVGSYVHRMVCVNGLMLDEDLSHTEEFRSRGVTEVALIARLNQLATEKAALSQQRLEEFVAADDEVIERPAEYVTGLAHRFHWSTRRRNQILALMPTLPEQATRYDVINLVTQQEHARGDREFRRLGGNLMQALESQHCARCGAVLN